MSPVTADSLYAALRKTTRLDSWNSLYPRTNDIDAVFEYRHGDVSDLAYIMIKILNTWKPGVAEPVWIRDRREGGYESSVPLTIWFDRLGVLVSAGGKERLYDFDRSLPSTHEFPWYLRGSRCLVVSDNGATEKVLAAPAGEPIPGVQESHVLSVGPDLTIHDSMAFSCSGSIAQHFRNEWYDLDSMTLHKSLESLATEQCLDEVETLTCNDWPGTRDLVVRFKGTAKGRAERMDSLLTVRPHERALTSLYDRLFSTHRRSDIILDEPLTISIRWEIPVPAGYVLYSPPAGGTLQGPGNMTCSITGKLNAATLSISAVVTYPEMNIRYDQYPLLIKTLQEAIKDIGREILFRKP